jgi:hypothetical protein
MYNFTAVNLALDSPMLTLYNTATFSLAAGEAPNFILPGPGVALTYDNVMVDFFETENDVITTQLDGLAAITIFSDGIQITSNTPGFNFFAGSGGGSTWTGNPSDPTFVPGIYSSYDRLGDYVQVAPVIPEPSTFVMLGTGLLGFLGVAGWRRMGRAKGVASQA